HCFLISGGRGGRVQMLAEAGDLAIANRKDMDEIALEFAPGVFNAPSVIAKRNDLVALRDELARNEFEYLLIARHGGEKVSYAFAAGALAGQRYALNFRQLPGNVIRHLIEQRLDISRLEVVVSLLDCCSVFLFAHLSSF